MISKIGIMYGNDNLTEREVELFWELTGDKEEIILKLIESKGLITGTVFYKKLTIVYQIDKDGDVIVNHITEDAF